LTNSLLNPLKLFGSVGLSLVYAFYVKLNQIQLTLGQIGLIGSI